jgi:hypothetical protein
MPFVFNDSSRGLFIFNIFLPAGSPGVTLTGEWDRRSGPPEGRSVPAQATGMGQDPHPFSISSPKGASPSAGDGKQKAAVKPSQARCRHCRSAPLPFHCHEEAQTRCQAPDNGFQSPGRVFCICAKMAAPLPALLAPLSV